MTLLAPVALVLLTANSPSADFVAPRTTRVEIRGPLARVTADLVVSLGSLRVGPGVSLFDLALPSGAHSFMVSAGESAAAAGAKGFTAARFVPLAAFGEGAQPVLPPATRKVIADEAAALRLVLQGGTNSDRVRLRYSYSVALSCREGWWRLDLPGPVDLAPVPGKLAVDLRMPASLGLQQVRLGAESFTARGRRFSISVNTPAQTSFAIAFRLARGPGAGFGTGAVMAASSSRADVPSVVGVCRRADDAPRPSPSLVIAVVDGSRSVGVVGLSHQRDLLRGLLSALPGSVRFNMVTFDRNHVKLFPVARLVTRETLAAIDQALQPERLANGSDLQAAVNAALEEMAVERAADPSAVPWLVIVTDGSLPDDQVGVPSTVATGLGSTPVASTIVRAENEDLPSAQAMQALRALAAPSGGILRLVQPPNVADRAQAVASNMRQGGDWFDLRLGKQRLANEVAPAAGIVATLPHKPGAVQGNPLLKLRFQFGGKPASLPVPSIDTSRSWSGTPATALVAVGATLPSGMQVYTIPLPPPARELLVKGDLERSVLRNALSLAYLPRARACYLNRKATDAAMRDLQGKVRLSLQIERGEMLAAKVVSSTLNHREIEACLVEAAFTLALPRPLLRDAPVEAFLNMVFRPVTLQAKPAGVDASAFDQELEVLLGPRTVFDPSDTLTTPPGI